MDSDSLGDAGVMLLVFGMLVCVSSQSMQQIAEVVIESCKWFAGRCKWFLLPDKSVDAPSGQVLSRCSEGCREQRVQSEGLVVSLLAGVV